MTNVLTSVTKSVVVDVPQQRAFDVFTTGIDSWWPRSHNIGSSPLKEFIMEPKDGGEWYGLCEDGSKSHAGHVIKWDPPNSVILAWQITGEWQFDPDFLTEVEVRFTAEAPDRTLVELEHRNLDRFGVHQPQMVETFKSDGGWNGLMQMFKAAAEGRPVVGRELEA
jgi:hypothetical protein